MKNKVFSLLHNPSRVLSAIVSRSRFILPDKFLVEMVYRLNMHEWPNLKNPKTFNEKLTWLKIYYRNPSYTPLVDKYNVKDYVKETIGEEYVIPTLGIWNHFDEIDFSALPQQFVLKTTHDSGNLGVIICKDKDSFDIDKARKIINKSIKDQNKVYQGEWPYLGLKPRIIAEKYMEDHKTGELRDYKFFCFNGEVKALFVASERQRREEPYFDFFDSNFVHLNFTQGHPNNPSSIEKPLQFDEMKRLASKLTCGIPCVRCDLYEVDGKVYFGELTFFHFGGIVPFNPREVDEQWGDWIKLPKANNNI